MRPTLLVATAVLLVLLVLSLALAGCRRTSGKGRWQVPAGPSTVGANCRRLMADEQRLVHTWQHIVQGFQQGLSQRIVPRLASAGSRASFGHGLGMKGTSMRHRSSQSNPGW
jgi:hypothetical protein